MDSVITLGESLGERWKRIQLPRELLVSSFAQSSWCCTTRSLAKPSDCKESSSMSKLHLLQLNIAWIVILQIEYLNIAVEY